jgi:E3 ubiquitin-protein ligase RNF181
MEGGMEMPVEYDYVYRTHVIDGRTYWSSTWRRRHVEGFSYYYRPSSSLRPVAADDTRANKRARVAEAAIQGLPEVTPKIKKLLQAECAVCLKDFDAEDKLRAMPCAHAFHDECIFQWLRLNATCPLCRNPLPPTKNGNAEDQETSSNQRSAPAPEDP